MKRSEGREKRIFQLTIVLGDAGKGDEKRKSVIRVCEA